MEAMKAQDVMSVDVVTISCRATVLEAAELMLDRRISGLPVVNEEGRLVGIVTEGDLLRRAEIGTELHPSMPNPQAIDDPKLFGEYLKSHGRHVEDIMTRDVVRVCENTPLENVAALMALKRIKRVLVMGDDKVAGIITRADFLRAFVNRADHPPLYPRSDEQPPDSRP
jgi:CBS domain-containing protein